MIAKPVLKKLTQKYLEDADVLLAGRRYSAAVYLTGYALELGLKYSICMMMSFEAGFPENKTDFDSYLIGRKTSLQQIVINNIKEIKHHQLRRLIFYSGLQQRIETDFFSEWNFVSRWTPSMRYQDLIMRQWEAEKFLLASQQILKILLQ